MPDPLDYFLPYQVRWIRCTAPVAIGEKSRRIGWTYASSYRAVERRVKLGTHLFFSSADLSAAREFIEECQRWARVFRVVAEDLGQQVVDEAAGLTAFVLRFENNARIVAGSSSPRFFRSKGGDADADEFAFHDQPRELYKAMQPAALMWGHQMRLWSTHNGEGSFFNQLVRDHSIVATPPTSHAAVANPPIAAPARRVVVQRVTLLDAVAQGLVEKIRGLDAPDPIARREFVEEIRATCPDDDAWGEEYLCRPAGFNGSLLSYEMIAACEAAGLKLLEVEEIAGRRLGDSDADATAHSPLYAGFDVGRKRDRSVLWVLENVGDVYWTRCLRVLEAATFTAQEQLLALLMASRRVRRLCIDSTGIGAMLAERLAQRFGHRVEPIHFSAPVKSEMAGPLVRLFQDRRVRIPADPTVREDLHKVRKIVTAAGNVRLDADRDDAGHADRFWALAMAHHAASDLNVKLPAPLARKPTGW